MDFIYSIREYNTESDGHTVKTIKDYIINNKFEKKYINFKKILAKELSLHTNLSIRKSQNIVDKSFKKYIKKFF
ncbi:MAG: hypothetical protein Kow0068_10110 [Marinilabiliales bacterium]